jgi:hypothetical protein
MPAPCKASHFNGLGGPALLFPSGGPIKPRRIAQLKHVAPLVWLDPAVPINVTLFTLTTAADAIRNAY